MYPALATAQALQRSDKPPQLYFLGAVGGMERGLVADARLPLAGYHEVYAGPIHGVALWRLGASVAKLSLGSLQALAHLRRIRPRVILLTGGWANLPVALGAKLLAIPVVIFLPDVEPGLTIRSLSPLARVVALAVARSAQYFPAGRSVHTGYPLQEDRLQASRAAAQQHFRLDAQKRTLLVFGGSRGARSINRALEAQLPRLLEAGLQILHITGALDWARSQAQVGLLGKHSGYHAFAYLKGEMGLAFAAADLALARAGASTLAELPHFGLPAILVPYPHAWRYQKVNADYLTERGAAIRIEDRDLPQQLYPTVQALLADEARLAEMAAQARALAQPDGAQRLAQLLCDIGGGQHA